MSLYSRKKVTTTVDFPCNLNALIKNMPKTWPYNLELLIDKYTILPFYKPFWPAERVEKVKSMMSNKYSQEVHLAAGIYSNEIVPWKYLRFCPECFKEDIKLTQEAYWHRIHQVPKVLICPKHRILIQNSTVRTYEIESSFYYTANESNCIEKENEGTKLASDVVERLVRLANDIQWLLNNSTPVNEPEWFRQAYYNILMRRGMVSKKGRVDQGAFLNQFIQYHSAEFLRVLDLLPDVENSHNWVSLMVRKYANPPHPIKHLLMIQFLIGSVQDFFEENHFFKGPFPCLNAACNHYHELVIPNAQVKLNRNRRPSATFTCECGFEYYRLGPEKDEKDKYKYTTIIKYGHVWEQRLIDLFVEKKLPLLQIATILKVDWSTVKKFVDKLNLKSSDSEIESAATFRDNDEGKGSNNSFENEKKEYLRNRWLTLINEKPGCSKSALRKSEMHTYYWLNYHDREWFDLNQPQKNNSTKLLTQARVDWAKRDMLLQGQIKEYV